MANDPVAFGDEFSCVASGVTHSFREWACTITTVSATIEPLDTKPKKIRRHETARIVTRGYHSTVAGGGTFRQLGEAQLNGTAPTALSCSDKEASPTSALPASFFIKFPLGEWKCVETSGGPGTYMQPTEWSATFECDFIA